MEFITADIAYSPEAKAIIDYSGAGDLFRDGDDALVTPCGKIAPWGADNMLPYKVQEKVESNEVVSSNLLFNIQTAYGNGIRPMVRVKEGDNIFYRECTDPEVLEFFEDNDISGYFLEQITDMMTFFNVFPEIILNEKGNKIVSLRHLEAVFSRYGSMGKGDREISKHYYSTWERGSASAAPVVTPVLSRYNTLSDLQRKAAGTKQRRFVLQVSMPTPGRTYYSRPYWWSVFQSGWYDLSELLPKFKKALLKNHLAVRYIVYISDEYWKDVIRDAKVAPGDIDHERKVKEQAVQGILEFLSEKNAKGGGLVSTRKLMPGGNGKPFDDKYVEIVPIEGSIKGGEFIEDAEEANNIISYAMGVHPNLNGATPGKGKGSLGGSDKRELMMIKQAMMRPFRDRLLKPLTLIKRFNGWDPNIVFAVPEYTFPTLDVEKSGKREIQNT